MPEKTLKEKVEAAKKCLDELDSFEQHKYGVVAVRKALTALEGRVKELEDELNDTLALLDYCQGELDAE